MAHTQEIPGHVETMDRVRILGDRLEAFVRASFAVNPNDPGFDRGVDLFEAGYADSVGLTELLAFIEQEFGVAIPDEALLSDAFASIDGMARTIVNEMPPST